MPQAATHPSTQPTYDLVIVGAGLTGSLIANKLGQEGWRVLLMDAGEELYFDRESGIDQRQPLLDRFYAATARVPNSPYPNLPYAPMEFEENLGTYYYGDQYKTNNPTAPPADPPTPSEGGSYGPYKSTYARVAGGTMYHWLGTTLRYLPSTFREKTLFDHATDWPFSYDTLEPYYCDAEREIGVSGDKNHTLGAWRSKPYPMPPILTSYGDRVMAERLQGMTFEGMPVLVEPTPQGRNSRPYQDRPACAGSANCVPICPIQAKYDATVHLKRALNPALDPDNKSGSVPVQPMLGAVATKLVVDVSGRVSGVQWRDAKGHDQQPVTGRLYVMCTHAIETAKLLLNSASAQPGMQGGAANSSDLVGRYLMDHLVRVAYGSADVPLYPFRGPLSTAGIDSLRDGPFRRYRSAFRVEIEACGANWALNAPFSSVANFLKAGVMGQQLWRSVGWEVNRQVQLDGEFEPNPNRDSRVRLARDSSGQLVLDKIGVPRPRIDLVIDEFTQKGSAVFEKLAHEVMMRMGGKPAQFLPGFLGAGHAMGTFRMGVKSCESVTDEHGRSWDHDNLYLTGSGLFPTVCSANPSLTIAAVTLRQIDHLKSRLQSA